MSEIILKTNGANPFLPPEIYIPDGEPKVFGDRVYLYGSHDLFNGEYCSGDYHVFSAPVSDLTRWTDHGVSFRSRNENGSIADVSWSDALLYAPDVIKAGDKYYLFFCLSDGSEGVAQSDFPEGPFGNAQRITMNGKPIEGIDPSVLYDNGKYYYTWGQFHLKIAELNNDMCTLKPETFRDNVITNDSGSHGFHEGSSLRKIGDKFCLIYASEWKAGYPNNSAPPTKLDYALSDSPYGPYVRRGTVIDNTGIDPQSWNNHGSIIKIKDKWYVFYHGSSNNSQFCRRARAERLTVDEERAVIKQAEMTSNGFLEYIPESFLSKPSNACRFIGGAYVTEREGEIFPLVNITDGSGMEYKYVHLTKPKYSIVIDYNAYMDCSVSVMINGKKSAEIALCEGNGKAEGKFRSQICDGVIEFLIRGGEGILCEINSIEIY